MKKHAVISILLLTVAYNLIGFMAAFQAIRSEWRQSVREKLATLAEEDVVHFVFAQKDIDLSKHEFQRQGKYYDILRIETQGDSAHVYCFDDATETRLTHQFEHIVFKNNSKNNDYEHKTTLCFQSLIKDFYFPLENNRLYPPSVYLPFKAVFDYKNRFRFAHFLPTDTPPPDVQATLVA
jgi:hypothetical protein